MAASGQWRQKRGGRGGDCIPSQVYMGGTLPLPQKSHKRPFLVLSSAFLGTSMQNYSYIGSRPTLPPPPLPPTFTTSDATVSGEIN